MGLGSVDLVFTEAGPDAKIDRVRKGSGRIGREPSGFEGFQ